MKILQKGIGGLLLALGIFLLGWGFLPPGSHSQRLKLPAAAGSPGLGAASLLTVEIPGGLRAGDSALARLTFSAGAESAALFQSHNVLAEARLEIPGASLRPSATVKQPLRPGQTLTFFWNIGAPEAGNYSGTAWFYLTFLRLADGAQTRVAVAALPVEIHATRLAGLTGEMARRLGALALFFAAALGLPLALKNFPRQK